MIKRVYIRVQSLGPYPSKYSILRLVGCIESEEVLRYIFDFNIQPESDEVYSDEWLEQHGINRSDKLLTYTKVTARDELVRVLDKFINKYEPQDRAFLMVFNDTKYDDKFLKNLLFNSGSNMKSYFWNTVIDVKVLASEFAKHKVKLMHGFELNKLCKAFGVPEPDLDPMNQLQSIYKLYRVLKEIQDKLYVR